MPNSATARTIQSKVFIALLAGLIFAVHSTVSRGWIAGYGGEPLITQGDLKQGDIFLAGYGIGRHRKATGIHDDIYARALYLQTGKDQILLISLDAVGFSQQLGRQLTKQLAADLKLPEDHILLSATHTHSGVDLQGLWGSITPLQSEQIIARTTRAALKALKQAQPARIELGFSDEGIGYNRRLKSRNIHSTIMSLMIASEKNTPIATLFSFGSHPVVLDTKNLSITSDWVYYARNTIEQRLKSHALFINGILGDVLPSMDGKASNARTFVMAERYGKQVGNAAANATGNQPAPLTERLQLCSREIDLKADNPALIGLTKTMNNGTILWPNTFSTELKTRVSVLRLGQLTVVNVPGEPLTAWGEKVLAKVPFPGAVFSLTHDTLGYIIDDEQKAEPGYEERYQISEAFSSALMTEIENLLKQCPTQKEEKP